MEGGATKGPTDPDDEVFDVGLLDQLESLGFPRLACKKALWNTGGSAQAIGQQSDPNARAAIVERAMMWCFEHGEDDDIAEPVDFLAQQQKAQQQESDDPYGGYFDASLVQVLQEMGFSTPRAHRGLFFTGNSSVEAAMEWIIGHSLDDDIDEPLDPEEVNSGPPDPCEELVRAMRPPFDLMLEQRLMGLCEMILRLQERHVFSREGDQKVAEGLLRLLQTPMESVMSCPDAPVCACRAVKAFAEMSDDLRQFFSTHEALTVILGCLDRGDPILTEETISCVDLITGSRGLPRQLVVQGALDRVLGTLEPSAGRSLPRFAPKVLRLARKICGQVRGASLSGNSLEKLRTLVIADDPKAALGAAQCFERLLAQHRVAGEAGTDFPVKLVAVDGGVLPRALLAELHSPAEKGGSMFSCACEVLTSLCIASEEAGVQLIDQGLLDASVVAIAGGADYQATWTLVQTLLIFLFDGHTSLVPVVDDGGGHQEDDQQLESGDAVEVLSRGSSARQQYSNGIVVRDHRDGSYVVDTIDVPNDGEPISRDRLRKWMTPAKGATALPESVLKLRKSFALELLPALLAKCQKQVHRALLSTLLLFVDRLALASSDETGPSIEISADHLSHIARIAQSLVGMDPWSAHLQGLRLVGSLVVLLPKSVVQLERHGVLERVQDLFSAAWSPTPDDEGKRGRISQSEAQKKAVSDTASRCLAVAETARADATDASVQQKGELQSLSDRITEGDEEAVADLVVLCCARDGITLHEFQEAEMARALLSFLVPDGLTIDVNRMATLRSIITRNTRDASPRGTKRGADRVVELLQGLLRIGDQLPLWVHGMGGAHGLGTLLKTIRVHFEPLPGSLATGIGSRAVAVQSVASMAEVQKYILEHARSTDQGYLEYCEQLVGCRIKLQYPDKPSSYANIMSFHVESGQHIIIHERCGTTSQKVLLPADFLVVRGRTSRSAVAAKRQVTNSKQAAAKERRLRQQQELDAAKANAEARRKRMVERHLEEGSLLRGVSEHTDRLASVIMEEDRAKNMWRLQIRLEEHGNAEPAPAPREKVETAPSLKLTSLGAVSVAARWTPLAVSTTGTNSLRLQLQVRSRGTKTWSVYDPESHCIVHGTDDQAELGADTSEVVILALSPSTRYEACLRIFSEETDEWTSNGPIETVCTSDHIIPDPSAVWEWQRDPGEFETYDQDSTARLEQMYTSSKRNHLYDLVIPGTDTRFQFDFERMIQTNENSGASRRIRRISDEVALKTLTLSHNERVCVRSARGQWIPGVISCINPDGTFDVECDTGIDQKALRPEDILSLTRAARISQQNRGRMSSRTSSLTRSWSAIDMNSARSNRGSSPTSARQTSMESPEELNLLDDEDDSCQCSCDPVPRRKKLRVNCFFGGFFCNDENEGNGTSRYLQTDRGSHDAELQASGSVFEALGRATGILHSSPESAEGTGIWLVKGGHAKYLALLHRVDNTVLGGWLDSRGSHMKKRCSGTLVNGELKLSQGSDWIFTATVTGNEMSGSWRQRDRSKQTHLKSETEVQVKKTGAGVLRGFLANDNAEIHPAHSDHPIEKFERESSWRCDVCGTANSSPSKNRRYRCVAGCDFDVCGACRDAGRKGKGTFQATREAPSSRGGRNQASLIWELPFTVHYTIESMDDEDQTSAQATAGTADTIWCPHIDCTGSTQTFSDRAACYRHMAAMHPSTNDAVPALGLIDSLSLSACKPCFESALKLLQVLHAEPSIRKVVTPKAWQSLGLMHQLSRQLDDPLSVATGVLPDWCAVLMRRSRQLFSLEMRKHYFMLTAFGPSRAITWFQAQQIAEAEAAAGTGQGRSDPRTPRGASTGPTTIPVLGALTVTLVQISRHNFLAQAAALMETHAKDRRELRVEWEGEPGTGKGVWPEFFSKAATELRRRCKALPTSRSKRRTHDQERTVELRRLWVDDDEGCSLEGDFVELELFPRPLNAVSADDAEATLCWFRFLGRLFAKGLLDSRQDCVRLVPLPLHPLFFELLVEQLPVFTQQQRWNALGRLAADPNWPGHALITGVIAAASENPDGSSISHYSQGLTVDEWLDCACFEDPVTGMPLRHGGANQTLSLVNLVEYLDLIFDTWLGDGVARQIEACREGFAEVASTCSNMTSPLLGSLMEQAAAYTFSQRPTANLVAALQIFSPRELQQLLCGKVEVEWTLQELRRTVKPGYAYTDTDKAYVWLLEELISFGQQERAAFLSFVTSSPRLPPGGLRQLPKGAIVVDRLRSDSDELRDSQGMSSSPGSLVHCAEDTMLPTARTCSQQLRLPSYSSREQLGIMLRVALKHGTEGFGME